MFKKLSFILFIGLSVISFAGSAKADIWEMAESDAYGRKAGGMLGRGFINAGSCFVDLIVQTVEKTQDGPPIIGTLTGIGSGAGCTILRAGSGIVDVVSFWVPGFNGVPVSKSYSNCLETSSSSASQNWQSGGQKNYVSSSSNDWDAANKNTYAAPSPVKSAPVKSTGTVTSSHDPMKYVKK